MQFGIFSVSDITRNPATGATPSEAARIDAIGRIAQRADEVGLDVLPSASTTTRHSSRPRRQRSWRMSRLARSASS